MLNLFIALGGVAAILFVAEFVTLKFPKALSPETTRKFVHIFTGIYVAFWPLFLSFVYIQLLCVALLAIVFVSKQLRIFKSIYAVDRGTYGELLFPVGIFVAATFASSGWVYMAAVLHLTLADGLAGLIGVKFLKHFSYKVMGSTKTIIGTMVFFVTSFAITTSVMLIDPASYGQNVPFVILLLPLTTAAIENLAIHGTDNILVPALVVFVMNSMRIVN